MHRTLLAGLLTIIGAAPFAVMAQSDTAQVGYAYVTYFECDAGREYRADEIIERSFKPHYDAAVEAGDIVQWSWLSHYVGGKWRRALVLTAANIDNLLAAAGALGEVLEETTPEAGRVFTEICPAHEDYIWQTVPSVGTAAGAARGPAGFSVYMDCDINREDRLDELMAETIGPVYEAQVASGGITSWTWLAHNVGGKFRRLLSLTGSDHGTLMRTRAAIIAQLRTGRLQRAYTQMNDICPDHEDYMWDIVLETP